MFSPADSSTAWLSFFRSTAWYCCGYLPQGTNGEDSSNLLSPFPCGAQSLANPPSPPLAMLSGWESDVSRQATAKICRYFPQERSKQWKGDTDLKDDSQLT